MASAAHKDEASTCRHLVLDAGAFIAGANLTSFGPDVNYWTVPDVLSEIKDEGARRYLQTFPYKLQQRRVSAEAMSAGENRYADATRHRSTATTACTDTPRLFFDVLFYVLCTVRSELLVQ